MHHFRYLRKIRIYALLSLAGVFSTDVSMAATPSVEELWRIIQQQQATIDSLEERLAQTDKQAADTAEAVAATADVVDEVVRQESTEPVDAQVAQQSYGTRFSRGMRDGGRTVLGGYGELHYNNLTDSNDTVGGDDSVERTDYHRFILFVGHNFTDDLRFFSELEVEHSLTGTGSPGEVELEQAWLEYDINNEHRIRAGLDILPIGLLNTTHEPNTFFGVERNRVETEIIPSTWWEAGLGANGEVMPGWNYDVVLHSGLRTPTSGGSAFRPRSGRLKVAEADFQALALTGRLRYTGIAGLEVAVSGQYQSDITGTADNFEIDAFLVESHIDYRHASGLGLRALIAHWDLSADNGLVPASVGADTLDGWYIEPSYRFNVSDYTLGDIGVFLRYSVWDERNGVTPFRYQEFDQFAIGLNWWPHRNVAVKFDYQWEDADGDVDALRDGFNLGFGYQF
ncbi:MAG: porin [Gammaproteobacteria bacterium]|nr:MAG: porin [Gammaproteobacteria bacterium]